jgi:hypothetical protein
MLLGHEKVIQHENMLNQAEDCVKIFIETIFQKCKSTLKEFVRPMFGYFVLMTRNKKNHQQKLVVSHNIANINLSLELLGYLAVPSIYT